jgi:acetate---CoA ligase (ADP-forming)
MTTGTSPHRGDMDLLNRLFRPQAIAVVGASDNPERLGSRFVAGLLRHGFAGDVYPVNPKYERILGLPAYPTVLDIPGPCDTAVLSIPVSEMEEAIRQCAAKGIAGAVIFAAGYKEKDEEGAQAERRLSELGAELGVRIVGPNGPGFINCVDRVSLTATSVSFRPTLAPAGRLGVVAQSGGVAGIICERAMDRGIGLSFVLCTGNEADVDASEALEYLVEDPHTDSIAVYIEGVGAGTRLLEAWDKASKAGKPVVIYKPGENGASTRAAQAHTGSLVGDDAVFDGLARQYGVVRAYDLDDMLEIGAALPRLPERDFESILLLTTSGGGSVLTADALGRLGMELPELGQSLQAELADAMPHFAIFGNPVDMTAAFVNDPPLFRRGIELVTKSVDHDVVVLILTVQRPEFAKSLADMIVDSPESKTGDLIVLWYAGDMSASAREYLRSEGVVVFERPGAVAQAVAGARIWNRRSRQGVPAIAAREGQPRRVDTTAGLFDVLESCGVPTPPWELVDDAQGAVDAGTRVPGPWAVKSALLALGRKSDVGGVHLGISGSQELGEAYTAVSDATGDPEVLVQSMVDSAFEFLLSVKLDEAFGPTVVLGMGGRFVELYGRAVVRQPPVTTEDIVSAIEELQLTQLLSGFRDVPPVDPSELATVANGLVATAEQLLTGQGVLEVNPLSVRGDGAGLVCLDVKLELPARRYAPVT